jgi:hypothetical protein
MSAYLAPGFGAGAQFFTNAGVVLSGGNLYTYQAGTTTPCATWTSSTQSVANANPIVLDSSGRSTNEIWLQGGQVYKFILKDASGNTLGTWDNVAGVNDVNALTLSEWIAGTTPAYVSGTSFTVAGNLTTTYQTNRRLQYTLGSGTFYGTITASSYSAGTGLTTVTFTADSTAMDNTVTAVSYGFLNATNQSLPFGVFAPLASPTFTGTPAAPTAAAGTSTTQLATTAFAMTNQGLQLLLTAAPSSVATVDFTTSIDATYDEYEIHLENLVPASSSNLQILTSANAGVSWDSSSYAYAAFAQRTDATTATTNSGSDNKILLTPSIQTGASGGGVSGVIRLHDPAGTASSKYMTGAFSAIVSAGVYASCISSGVHATTAVVNAIRIMFSTGNISSGKVKLYGVRKS